MYKIKILILLAIVVAAGLFVRQHHQTNVQQTAQKAIAVAKVDATKAAKQELDSHCKTNTLSQEIIVGISARHMWACEGPVTVYDSPVITGMEMLAADLTPTGTYKIYAKQTNTVLKGSDSTGSWNDPVSYWMPFLSNQYGIYGFHDATWRADSEFGNVDPNSKDASHGCVEEPLATAKWIYNWAPIGTTVTIQT